jgi:nitroimidazol reductase NimA-like FMN-containing flavoprotein (pyridoxamine 5'-phosphate oxidase superfamily)
MVEPALMRRKDKEISEIGELHRILDEASVLRLAMVEEGRPYVVPLTFAREGDDLWIHCAAEGRKVRCLGRDPAVCVEVDRFGDLVRGSDDDPCTGWTVTYESVIGFGEAQVVDDESEKVRGLTAIMRKFSGRDEWAFSTDGLSETTVIRVHVASLTGKRSGLHAAQPAGEQV